VPLMAGEVEKWGTKLTGQVRVPICRLRERSFNSLLFPKAGAYQSSPPIIPPILSPPMSIFWVIWIPGPKRKQKHHY